MRKSIRFSGPARTFGLLAALLAFGLSLAESTQASGFRADKLSTGEGHSCAIRDGGAWCWGSNSSGELGNGTTNNSAVPVPVTGLSSGVTEIAAGASHTCAIKDGGAWCWGTNQRGELGNGNYGGTQTRNPLPIPVTGLDAGVTAISAGRGYSCASLFGAVGASYDSYCWGSNLNWRVSGEDGAPPGEIPLPAWTGVGMPFLTISAGYGEHTCGIIGSGADPWQSAQARCWGNNEYGQSGRRLNPDPGSGQPFDYFPSPMKKAVVINNDIFGTKQLSAISAGADHTCLVNRGGVMCQGKNNTGQLGDGTTIHTVDKDEEAGERHIGWVSGLGPGSDVTSLLTGWGHSCALSTTKGMRCWGYNRDGQLGDGTSGWGNMSAVPVQATAFEAHGEVTAISGLDERTCAIVGGGVWCSGDLNNPGPHPVPEAPKVVITGPADGALTVNPTIEVSFQTTGTPAPSCKVNGTDEAGPAATVPLQPGTNTITVTCTSTSGSDTATIAVSRYSQVPVTITAPAAGPATAESVNVAYTVNGATTIPGDSTCEVNGNASTDPAANEVQLTPGANTITVSCSNPATSREATVTVTRYSPLVVAITDPADAAGTTDGQVNVAYTVNGQAAVPADSGCEVNGSPSSDASVNPVPLAPGPKQITVSCSNPATSGSDGITVYRNQAPVISDVMPRGEPYTGTEPEIDVSFTAAGYPAPSCTVNGRPSGGRTTETLEPGMNYFVIRCENAFGGETHSATETVPVQRMAAPVVTISSPEDSSAVTGEQVPVTFTVTGHESPACTVNGTSATSPADVSLTLGINTITVRCQNSMGLDQKSVTVTRQQVPRVTLGSPADGLATTAAEVDVEFTAVGRPDPDCSVNGQLASGQATVGLGVGANLIRVLCTNSVGEDSREITVYRNQAPQVILESPGDGSETTAARVDVEFTATGYPAPDCTVNGQPSAGEASLDLSPGENLIRVLCSNQEGEDSAEVTVTRHQVPQVSVGSPADGFETTASQVNVEFSAGGHPAPDCTVNGQPASGQATVGLDVGENLIRVLCTNSVGEDSREITVNRIREPHPARRKPAISSARKVVRIGAAVRFRLRCDSSCQVAPTLRVGPNRRLLRPIRRTAGTHRVVFRLGPRTVAALRARKRKHPGTRIVLILRPKSAEGTGRTHRIRIKSAAERALIHDSHGSVHVRRTSR